MAFASITDWSLFENPFRTWGLAGSASVFNPLNFGVCTSGNCQLYDFRLAPSDTLLRNAYGAWTNNGTCPASLNPATASNVLTNTDGDVFFLAAWELLSPWDNPSGDYDGLCEGGETCIFTPNLGSYQGMGDVLSSTPCTTGTGNGIASPVRVYAYPEG
jgi:hypothetical protein